MRKAWIAINTQEVFAKHAPGHIRMIKESSNVSR